MENKVMFFHTKPEKGKRRCTFAGVIDGNIIKIGISMCSRKDHFQKRLGRIIAEGRARSSNNPYILKFTEYPIRTFVNFCKNSPELASFAAFSLQYSLKYIKHVHNK